MVDRPTITLGKANSTFVAGDTQWSALRKDGEKVTIASHPHAYLLFLTLTLSEAERRRQEACKTAGITSAKCPPLPIAEIIKAGLTFNSVTWQALALDRLNEAQDIGAFEAELEHVVTYGKTQAIRHRALKLKAQLKRL